MGRTGRRVRVARGIYKDGSGYGVYLPNGKPSEQRFPLTADLAELKDWRADEIRRRRRAADKGTIPAGTFAADAQLYLSCVTALTTYAQRITEIAVWVDLFGDRRRASIKAHEIRAARDRWLTVGPKLVQRGKTKVAIAAPLQPSTVNKRLRALQNLWTVLDGKHAENPAREVADADEGAQVPRGLPAAVVDAILSRMPLASQTAARLHVMAATGLAQSEMARLDPAHVHLEGPTPCAWVPPRKKGRGAKGGLVPLSPRAVAAFQRFVALDCYGPFSTSSMWAFFQRYARDAGYTGLRPYDLRHTLFSGVYAASKDEGAVQSISRHGNRKTLRRYTEAVLNPRAADALASYEDTRLVPSLVPSFAPRLAPSPAVNRTETPRKRATSSR